MTVLCQILKFAAMHEFIRNYKAVEEVPWQRLAIKLAERVSEGQVLQDNHGARQCLARGPNRGHSQTLISLEVSFHQMSQAKFGSWTNQRCEATLELLQAQQQANDTEAK